MCVCVCVFVYMYIYHIFYLLVYFGLHFVFYSIIIKMVSHLLLTTTSLNDFITSREEKRSGRILPEIVRINWRH